MNEKAVERAMAVLQRFLLPDESDNAYRATVREVVEKYDEERIRKFCADGHSYERLRMEVAALVRAGGALSEPLMRFVANNLEGEKPPKKKKRPDRVLNFIIAYAAQEAELEAGKIYRNAEPKDKNGHEDSACDAVVVAAQRLGLTNLQLTYDKVAHHVRRQKRATTL